MAQAAPQEILEQAGPKLVLRTAQSFRRKSWNRAMDLQGIIFGAIAAAALLFLLIGIGRGMISLPPLYGKNSSTKKEPPENQKPSR